MSRRAANWVLVVVTLLFLVGILDVSWADPTHSNVPERIISVCAVILSGVAIGMILSAMNQAISRHNHAEQNGPEDHHDGR